MDIKCNLESNVLYVMLIGELDEYTANFTRNILDESFAKYSFDSVVIDLKDLNFMDSTGIGVLIGRYKNLRTKSKSMFVSNPNKTIEKIFNMSGIFEIMPKIN